MLSHVWPLTHGIAVHSIKRNLEELFQAASCGNGDCKNALTALGVSKVELLVRAKGASSNRASVSESPRIILTPCRLHRLASAEMT